MRLSRIYLLPKNKTKQKASENKPFFTLTDAFLITGGESIFNKANCWIMDRLCMFVVITHSIGQKNESNKSYQRSRDIWSKKKDAKKKKILWQLWAAAAVELTSDHSSLVPFCLWRSSSIITQGSAADHNTGLRVGGRTTDCFSHAFGHIALHNCSIFLRVDLLLDILLKRGSFQSKSALKREFNSGTLSRYLDLKFISVFIYSLSGYKLTRFDILWYYFYFLFPFSCSPWSSTL